MSNSGSNYQLIGGPYSGAIGGYACPMLSGNYYTNNSSSVGTGSLSSGVTRGGRLLVGRTSVINSIGLEITSAGSAGAILRLGVYNLDYVSGNLNLLLDVGNIDGTVLGLIMNPISLSVTAGQELILIASAQGGAATPPSIRTGSGEDMSYYGSTNPVTISGSYGTGLGVNGVVTALPQNPAYFFVSGGGVPRLVVGVQ